VTAAEQQLRANLAYQDALATAGECIHGQPGGELVRPWTGTPACALCRRRDPAYWWRLRVAER
jgi:hypothetical protein